MGKINWNNKDEVNKHRREYRRKNKGEYNRKAKIYRDNNKDKMKESWNKTMFDGKKDQVLERDNWECQVCGMSQEKSIELFNRELSIHHIDGKGAYIPKEQKNNDINNLITMCMRCHKSHHMKLDQKKRFGNLLEQDDSEYRYPKIRDVLNERVKISGTLSRAKKELAKELGVSFWTIDNMCYERRTLNRGRKK